MEDLICEIEKGSQTVGWAWVLGVGRLHRQPLNASLVMAGAVIVPFPPLGFLRLLKREIVAVR